jgi:hypothetical protein
MVVKKPLKSASANKAMSRNLAAVTIFVVVNWGVWNGGYAADDGPNSLVPYWTKYLNGISGFESWVQQTELWTTGWMNGQGRFFPTAVAVSRGAFIFITSLQLYKFAQLLSLVVLVLLIALTISRKLKNPGLFAPSILLSTLLFQVRHDFDPYFAFSFLLPLTMILLLLLLLLIDKLTWSSVSKNCLNILLLMTVSFLCFTTYEYSLLLSPILLILSLDFFPKLSKPKLWSLSTIGMVGGAITLFTFLVLRPRRENKLPSYEFAFNFFPFLKAFFSQLIAPFPFSQQLFGTLEISTPHRLYVFLILFAILFQFVPFWVGQLVPIKFNIGLAASGIYLWVIPALLVALTQRWQMDNALSPGKAYLPVLFQAVGIAFISFSIYAFLKESLGSKTKITLPKDHRKKIKISNQGLSAFDRAFISLLIGLPLYFVSQANFQQFGNGDLQSARLHSIQIASKGGWLDSVPTGSRIVSWDMNDATPINKAVFSVESGIDLSMFNHPQDFLTLECANDSECNPIREFKELAKTQNLLIRGERRDIQRPSRFFLGDVLFYTPNASIFVLSPIVLTEEVMVERSQTRVFWIIGKDEPLVGKVIGGECIQPPTEFTMVEGREIRTLEVSVDSSFPILRAIDRGQTCSLLP